MTLRRYLGAAVLAALLCAGCDRGSHPGGIGAPAPGFSISDAGHTYDLKQFRGNVVVLNFWGPWCVPCLREMPSLMGLQRQMPQLRVLAIGVPAPEGMANGDEAAYRRYVGEHSMNVLTAYDGAQRINQMFGTVQFPETYIIDKQGVLRRKFVGEQSWNDPEIVRYLQQLVDARG